MPLHQFFALLEGRSELTVPSRLLDVAIGSQAAAALCEARVLAPHGHATWYPCARSRRGCRRAVAVDRDELLLLCGRPFDDCATETVPASELGQHALDEPALLRLLQRLFGVEEQPVRTEGTGQPVWLGRTAGGACDVWVWLRPSEPAFATWMGDLEIQIRDRQRALVLVPTHARIHSHTFERYGAGQPIEVVHLDRALTVDAAQIVRAPSRALGAPQPQPLGPAVDRPGTRLRVEVGVRWSHITFEYVDPLTVAVRVGAHDPKRLTPLDLGLRHGLAGDIPPLWELLLDLCAGNGTCPLSSVSAPTLAALRTRATRLSQRLCAVFGLADAPLHVDRRAETVTADFVARSETRRSKSRRDR